MGEVAPEVFFARTGRNRQRFDENYRLVAGCIPYRLKLVQDKVRDGLLSRLEVLMISSPNRHDLIFPKGGWENDETLGEAACREALEEAGVRGIINESILGEWKFRSKSRQNSCSLEGTCKGYMFALEVTEELQYWPEQGNHERRWVCVSEAWKLCRYDWMREALAACIKVLSDRIIFSNDNLVEPSNYYFVKTTTTEQAIDSFC
ncbi:Nudix hydrolase 12, mitochondrial [Dendrobium catenatum]|uniref:Nudix hydrolase 12, mitochondrial n=1 Tax=Dendrobium catenatum TaxID=906689 RepID=A0A2I0VNF5_9ASPA|nr:Nudix hydrolase 12, mitochondrial [Dendrobium catenatum]